MVTVSRSPFSKEVSLRRDPLTGGADDDGERNFSLRHSAQRFPTPRDRLSTHSDQLLGRREPGTGQLAPGRGTAGHPKMLQRIYRFNEFLTKASFPRPPAPPPTHTGAQCTLQYTYKPADPAVTPGQACRAHASRPKSRARVAQRRASRSAAHIAGPAAAGTATPPLQVLSPHSMMPASRLVRQRFEGRPVVRTPAAPGPALTSHRGEPARWSVRRPVEHVCTAAAPPSPGRATPQGAPGPRHAEKPRRSAGRVGSARSAAPSSIASARTPAPAPAAVAPHRTAPPIRDGLCRFDSCAESPVPTSVDPARPLRRSASPLRPEPVRAPARISRSSAPCCPACPPPLPS